MWIYLSCHFLFVAATWFQLILNPPFFFSYNQIYNLFFMSDLVNTFPILETWVWWLKIIWYTTVFLNCFGTFSCHYFIKYSIVKFVQVFQWLQKTLPTLYLLSRSLHNREYETDIITTFEWKLCNLAKKRDYVLDKVFRKSFHYIASVFCLFVSTFSKEPAAQAFRNLQPHVSQILFGSLCCVC